MALLPLGCGCCLPLSRGFSPDRSVRCGSSLIYRKKKKTTCSPHVQLMTIQPYLKSYYLIYFPDSLCLQFSVCYPLTSQGVMLIDTHNAVTPSKSYLYQILHLLKPCEMKFWMSSAKDDDTFESSTPCYYFVGFAFSTGSYRGLSVSE